MSFILRRGKVKTVYLPVTTSTAFTKDTLVSFSAGLLTAATSATTAVNTIGVIRKTIASTDTDYATARTVPVDVPVERCTEWEADVTSGLVAADIMKEVDLTDAANVNRAASAIQNIRVKEVLSTTKGVVWIKFMGSY